MTHERETEHVEFNLWLVRCGCCICKTKGGFDYSIHSGPPEYDGDSVLWNNMIQKLYPWIVEGSLPESLCIKPGGKSIKMKVIIEQ